MFGKSVLLVSGWAFSARWSLHLSGWGLSVAKLPNKSFKWTVLYLWAHMAGVNLYKCSSTLEAVKTYRRS